MATVSMLVFIEECVYIYKKVPPNKKAVIIWVTGGAPVIATTSCLGMWVPRATMFTDMTSTSYFAIVMFKFLILMIEEVGGDKAFLKHSENKSFKISTGPCCCCCPCLPDVPTISVHTEAGVLPVCIAEISMSSSGAAIWINCSIGVIMIIALWPVAIMFMHVRVALRTLKIIPKYAMYQPAADCYHQHTGNEWDYCLRSTLPIPVPWILRQYDPIPELDDAEETKIVLTSKTPVNTA
ncbi:Organic solute transporter subunit alpha [Labeo rohita]|uniref:Organic solute transporter subunit alpha n=1 Tax=Labeo rohita TaxID=84645 RepID=A0ABQ8LF50_LABRO|nr:Organic solute transporter subunit alpha [Labeo rohita]